MTEICCTDYSDNLSAFWFSVCLGMFLMKPTHRAMLITILMSGKLNWKGSCAVAPGAFATGIVKVEVESKNAMVIMWKKCCV